MKNKNTTTLIPYIGLLVMILVCLFFGTKRLFSQVGFYAIAVVFVIAIGLALVLSKSLSQSVSKGDDEDDDEDDV